MKRIFDLVIAFLFLVPAFVIVAVCCCLVAVTTKGPALFYQKRVGRDGRLFTIIKIRSMYVDTCQYPRLVAAGDLRVTPFGRFLRVSRIDELPQLVNVLLGHMSIVGPRPLTKDSHERALLQEPRFGERLSVRPGMAGLAQLYGAVKLFGPRNRLRMDTFYIQRSSVFLDLWILARTAVLLAKAGPW